MTEKELQENVAVEIANYQFNSKTAKDVAAVIRALYEKAGWLPPEEPKK
jgi:hypothetical protein